MDFDTDTSQNSDASDGNDSIDNSTGEGGDYCSDDDSGGDNNCGADDNTDYGSDDSSGDSGGYGDAYSADLDYGADDWGADSDPAQGGSGVDSFAPTGVAGYAADSLASGIGDIGHGMWAAAKGVGYAAWDLDNLVGDGFADAGTRLIEAYHGFTNNQPELQRDDQGRKSMEHAIEGRKENILRDLGIHDGEREPNPEWRAIYGQ